MRLWVLMEDDTYSNGPKPCLLCKTQEQAEKIAKEYNWQEPWCRHYVLDDPVEVDDEE